MKQNIDKIESEILYNNYEHAKDIITYTYNGLYSKERNIQKSFEITSLCASKGDEDCKVRLAYLLTFENTHKDTKRAFKIIKSLIKKKNPAAISLLGYYYFKGVHIDRNIKKALFCFKSKIIRGGRNG